MIKHFITSLLLTTCLLSPLYSQQPKEVGIDDRMTLYFPIFDEPDCAIYLTEFGASSKLVKDYANSVGINFFANMPIPNVENVTSIMYTDPEAMVNNNGETLSQYIFYSFIFNEDDEYFGFSTHIRFESEDLARRFQENLLQKVKARRYTKTYTGLVECKEKGKNKGTKKMIISKVEKNTATFVILDYTIITRMSLDASRL